MVEAVARARETLPAFWDEYEVAGDSGGFLLKVACPTPDDDLEHIWVDSIVREGERLEGRLTNEPNSMPGLHARDRIAFGEADISDWAYPCARGYHGHFTTRVIMACLDPREAAEIRKMLAPTSIETTA
jgi:uncharacterized protein YegJ (DUF2314 family)